MADEVKPAPDATGAAKTAAPVLPGQETISAAKAIATADDKPKRKKTPGK